MAKTPAPTQKDFAHTWYLQEWMKMHGKKQADLQKELDWSKAKANAVWHGQQYTQSLVEELSPWLNVRPYELLLHPDDAMAIRRMRADAARIVSSAAIGDQSGDPEPAIRQKRA